MSVAIVIVVVMAWVVILAPNFVRRRAGGSDGIHSISHFHQHLRVLEHSAPTSLVTPAFRLRAVEGSGATAGYGSTEAPKLTVVKVDPLPRPALAFLGEDPMQPSGPPARPDSAGHAPVTPVGGLGANHASARQLTLRRRRDTLTVLTLAFVTSGVVGFVPGAQLAWALTFVSAMGLVGYVALLVHLRRMAQERGRKLHHLAPRQRRPEAGVAAGAAMAGRFAHPSYQAAVAL
jgi:hypothetical protein